MLSGGLKAIDNTAIMLVYAGQLAAGRRSVSAGIPTCTLVARLTCVSLPVWGIRAHYSVGEAHVVAPSSKQPCRLHMMIGSTANTMQSAAQNYCFAHALYFAKASLVV